MNVYWIDSYQEYDPALVDSVMNLFMNFYRPLLSELNLDFQVIDISSLVFWENQISLDKKNIFNEKAIAYINCTNPSVETEVRQKSLYDIAIKSNNLSVLNYIRNFPLVDKNKSKAIILAKEIGLPTIETISLENPKAVTNLSEEIISKLGFPTIIKPIDMFGGIAVHVVYDKEQLVSILEILSFANRKFIAQKKYSIVADCRLYIADFSFISCLKRIPQKINGLGNIAKGATAISYIPPVEVINKSIELAQKINANFLCVDWFELKNGEFIFSEIETAGGFVQLPANERKLVAEKLFRWKQNDE